MWFWHDCVPATTASTHTCTGKLFLPQRVPVVRRTRQPSMFFRDITDTNQSESTVAISNSTSQEIIWGFGGPEEDHQLHHCCWTGRVGEREVCQINIILVRDASAHLV